MELSRQFDNQMELSLAQLLRMYMAAAVCQPASSIEKTDPVLEAPTPGRVWGRIIQGKPYTCTVQCREVASTHDLLAHSLLPQ